MLVGCLHCLLLNACEAWETWQDLHSKSDVAESLESRQKEPGSCREACLGQWHLAALSSHSTASSGEHSFRSALPAPGTPFLQPFLCCGHAIEFLSLQQTKRLALQDQDSVHKTAGSSVQDLSSCWLLQAVPFGWDPTEGMMQ